MPWKDEKPALEEKPAIRTMTWRYAATAMLQATFVSLLLAYPVASLFVPEGQAPIYWPWLVVSAAMTAALTTYSLLPKPMNLRRLNWVISPGIAVTILVISVCVSHNVAANLGWVFIFTVVTAGAPIWLPALFTILHMNECKKLVVGG